MTVSHSQPGSSEPALFECEEFRGDAFRSMEVQICGETRTVQFCVSDHGGDHMTSPACAITWSDALKLTEWVNRHVLHSSTGSETP